MKPGVRCSFVDRKVLLGLESVVEMVIEAHEYQQRPEMHFVGR